MAVFVADEQAGNQRAGSPPEPPVAVDVARLRHLAAFVLADRGVPASMELSVLAVDVDVMTELNVQHMGHMGADGPTDVLAFPIDAPDEVDPGQPALLGDVVVCPAVAARQAAERGRDPQDELDLLVVHGILHLLGHDHAEPDEQRVMFALTDRLLSDFAAAGADPAPAQDGAAP